MVATASTPLMRTRLARDVPPLTGVIADFVTPSRSARNAIRQALALPATGGE